MRQINSLLVELGEKYKPTKQWHNYLQHYHTHFSNIRHEVKSVLEIGVQTNTSIRMWEEYFPNATIYGLDIDPKCKEFEGGRVKIYIGDQSDVSFLKKINDESGGFDIIIDDGSHIVSHQITTFLTLLPLLNQHGIYVVEDIGPVVGDIEHTVPNLLRTLTDDIFYAPEYFSGACAMFLGEFPKEARWVSKNIAGLAFYRWIGFVMKGKNPEDNPYLKKPDELTKDIGDWGVTKKSIFDPFYKWRNKQKAKKLEKQLKNIKG